MITIPNIVEYWAIVVCVIGSISIKACTSIISVYIVLCALWESNPSYEQKRKAYHYSTPSTVKENVLNREFEATRPNEKWLTDVTVFKIAGMSTKYYLSAIIDLYDLSIISYQISPKNDNILVFETFHKAFNQYPDAQPLVHSDRGFQYTSPSFNSILKNQGCVQSMSRVGCCIDNGPIENFWGQIKSERYYLEDYRSPETLINGITDYIDFL